MARGRALEEGARSVWGAGAGDAEDESARRLERLLSLGVSLSGEDASALPAIVFFSLARLFWNHTWTSLGVILSSSARLRRRGPLGFLSVRKTSSRTESWCCEVRLRVLTALGM